MSQVVASTTGNTDAVSSSCTGTGSGKGVSGHSDNANGVYGESNSTVNAGVCGNGLNGANGVYAVNTSNGNGCYNAALYALNQGGGIGAMGQANGGLGVGVYGVGGVNGYGVEGISGYIGVYGGTTGSSPTAGVFGTNNGAAAIWGECTGQYGKGILGTGYGTSVNNQVGVWGSAGNNAAMNCYGVYGYTNGLTSYGCYAGYFAGTVTKSGGTFLIDHPQDPENKYLSHSFVESPDMKNVYDGVGIADANGELVVTMPGYFESLNKDFRYQLTAIGSAAPSLHVKSELKNFTFTIAGATVGQKVSWQITGIRQDPWALANPVVAEHDKLGDHKGKYKHPEVYGKPPEMGIHHMEQKTPNSVDVK